jgi:hypothetical protein
MPMRRKKLGRTMIYNKLKDHLDDSMYSYLENGVELPGIPDDQKEDQRYFNPDWYNSTLFSVVNEDSDDREAKIWTEKTCKPLAFFHPFILVAQQGVLNMITSSGFQSFPELFDESYDCIPDLENRVQFVYEQIINVDRSRLRSSETKEKLVYNRNRFFDTTLIYNRLTEKLMIPLMEYLND